MDSLFGFGQVGNAVSAVLLLYKEAWYPKHTPGSHAGNKPFLKCGNAQNISIFSEILYILSNCFDLKIKAELK